MQVKLIKYCCIAAFHENESRHPQDVMSSLGITYQHSTPQSIVDQWWFWIPEGEGFELPKFITITYKNPMKNIGNGLNKETAKFLRDYKKEK